MSMPLLLDPLNDRNVKKMPPPPHKPLDSNVFWPAINNGIII